MTWPDFSEDMGEGSYTYTWKNGNIVKIVRTYNDEIEEERTFTYSSYPYNIPPYFTESMGMNVFLYWQGYFGRRCRNLPLSETVHFPNISPQSKIAESTFTFIYDYEINKGLVEKITKSWTYKGVPSTQVYELEWY